MYLNYQKAGATQNLPRIVYIKGESSMALPIRDRNLSVSKQRQRRHVIMAKERASTYHSDLSIFRLSSSTPPLFVAYSFDFFPTILTHSGCLGPGADCLCTEGDKRLPTRAPKCLMRQLSWNAEESAAPEVSLSVLRPHHRSPQLTSRLIRCNEEQQP